jgi:hypothetical protein
MVTGQAISLGWSIAPGACRRNPRSGTRADRSLGKGSTRVEKVRAPPRVEGWRAERGSPASAQKAQS